LCSVGTMKQNHITDPGQAIESYYAILDYCQEMSFDSVHHLRNELPDLYQHFVNVFEVLKQARGWDE